MRQKDVCISHGHSVLSIRNVRPAEFISVLRMISHMSLLKMDYVRNQNPDFSFCIVYFRQV
jgi:hypothetical protein